MKVVCISGKSGHGKDVLAKLLEESLTDKGYRVLITHYADLLKYVCKTFFDWNGEKDDYGRSLLQHVGTDVVRKQNPNYWVDFIVSILKLFPNEWDYVIIPDCRYPNEVERLRKSGLDVKLVRIVRQNFNSKLTKEQKGHSSETTMDSCQAFDVVIQNDGTLQKLKEKVRGCLKSLNSI